MTNLIDKLKDLGRYEIGMDDIQRSRNNIESLAYYDRIFRLSTLTAQGVLAVYGAQELYQGNLKRVGAVLTLIGMYEVIKYGFHRLTL